MPAIVVRIAASAPEVQQGLDRIRAELEVPLTFPPDVERAALAAVQHPKSLRPDPIDARDLELVTIDPPGSRDLDQAYSAERTSTGLRVRYAIADVASLVVSGDAVDVEARTRGVTLYLPDRRASLYPECIGEGAASLLPDGERPALLWTIDLDADGAATAWRLETAVVRSRQAWTYREVQQAIDGGTASESLMLLREIGKLRKEQERARGGVSIAPPSQEVTHVGEHFEIAYDAALPVEGWNAQVSLLAGMCAASTMISGGVGIVRTLPSPDEGVLRRLRRAASALDVQWTPDSSYADVVSGLSSDNPKHAAFLTQALDALRGASYSLVGAEPGPPPIHGAIAAPYAHVTAPLRRLADRFANEIVLALCSDTAPPSWARDALPLLPEAMQDANRHQKAVERAVVDLVECLVLRAHVGQTFTGAVIDADEDRATVQLTTPPVIATLSADGLELGSQVEVRVDAVDLDTRRVEFSVS